MVVKTHELIELGTSLGLSALGVCRADTQEPARSVLRIRKEAGLAGEMQFTYRNPIRSTDPESVLPGARSLVVAALRYADFAPSAGQVSAAGRIARYSWVDYYELLNQKLLTIAQFLEDSGAKTRLAIDSNNLVDRNAAWSAGIGWYGKNGNLLLNGLGSWHVLGSVVTDAVLESTGPLQPDNCGRCSRCIDECPTGAIIAPGVVDARACIAWLVQAAGAIPHQFREAVADRLYGCDDCQEVCPPNRVLEPLAAPEGSTPWVDPLLILDGDDDYLSSRYGRWYIAARDFDNLRRTALIVLGNVACPSNRDSDRRVFETLLSYYSSDNSVFISHSLWALRRLGLAGALTEPQICRAELEPSVLAEKALPVTVRFSLKDWQIEPAAQA